MAMTQQEMLNELLVDVAKDQAKKEEVARVLTAAAIDVESNARVAFALLELAVEAFRKHGISPCMLAPILHLKAHGVTSDRLLKTLMSLQAEDELKDDLKKAGTTRVM